MVKTFTFPNGFRIVYEKPKATLPITSIQVFCKIGSIYETDGIRGAAHVIEHMCFKGTRKIAKAEHIAETYDEIGAFFNATTNKNTTIYIVKCHNDFVEKCMSMLSDMMMNSAFKRNEFEKEKQVVKQETIRLTDNGSDICHKLLDESLYSDSSYAHAVDRIDYHKPGLLAYDEVYAMYKSFYRPSNMVASIVSKLPFSTIVKLLQKTHFARSCSPEHPWKYRVDSIVLSPNVPLYNIHKHPGMNTLHMRIGFRTCSQFSTDKYALDVLQNVVGGYMSSRMFSILRGKHGLTYSSGASATNYESMGDFTFFAETDSRNILETNDEKGVLPRIVDMICDLQKHGITPHELQVSKQNIRGSMALALENNDSSCYHNGNRVILYNNDEKSIVPYCDIYDTYYHPITRRDVNNVIKKYIKKSNMCVCIVSNTTPPLYKVKSICEKILV
jgi:predicted Zn-dependent peptidase